MATVVDKPEDIEILVKLYSVDGSPDDAFLDNLIAANRFKSFLLERGVEVPDSVVDGIAALKVVFKEDYKNAEARNSLVERNSGKGDVR